MREFTSFQGITPANSRYRHIDHLFEEQRRRLYGDQTISGDYELNIPHANITQLEEEERGGYLIELAAPGYQRSDFHVSVHNDVLTIKGELEDNRQRDHSSFTRREHNYHTFTRSFTLPESADEDHITASYVNGILEVFVPVLKPVEQTRTPRRIEVGS